MSKFVFLIVLSLTISTAFAQTKAVLAQQSGKLDEAKAEIDKAMQDAKLVTKAKTWFYRAKIYESIANDRTGIYTKLDSNAAMVAYDSYKKAIELDKPGGSFDKDSREALATNMYAILFNQGIQKYQNKNYADAIKAFQLAQETNPKDTLAFLYAGIASQQNKDMAGAKTYLEKYLEVGGKDPEVYGSIVSIYQSEGNNEKALEYLKKGIAANPTSKSLKDQELNLSLASGKTDDAINNLKAAVEREPNNPLYQLNLGIMYDNVGTKLSEQGDKAEAEAKKLDPAGKKPESVAKRAEADKLKKEAMDRKAEAQAIYNKVLQLDPNNFDANFNLGVFNFNQAVEVAKKLNALDLKQYQKDGKRLEGEVKAKFEQSLPFFEKAHQTNPKDLINLGNLRKVYSQLKRQADVEKMTKEIEAAEASK